MQKINIVCVGKIKEEFFRGAVNEYLKRLSRFAKTEIKEMSIFLSFMKIMPENKNLFIPII